MKKSLEEFLLEQKRFQNLNPKGQIFQLKSKFLKTEENF